MKKIKVIYKEAPDVAGIEVIVCSPEKDAQVEELIELLSSKGTDTLAGTDSGGAICNINISDIISVSAYGKKVQIVTGDERYTVRQPLQTVESKLETRRFVRISRYEIINLDKVKKYDFTLSGTLRLELAGGMETWASRRNIPMIRKKLSEKE